MSAAALDPLADRLRRLLALTGLLAVLATGGLAWLAWDYVLDAYAERLAEQTRTHYRAKLAQQRLIWNKAGHRLRSEIEFLRFGEMPPAQRRARLLAFFTAQGEYREFEGLMLTDAGGMPFFTLGCQAMLQEGGDRLQSTGPDLPDVLVQGHCQDSQYVYYVFHTPLWLGPQGQGLGIYAAALDHGFLTRLARKMDHLYLYADGRIQATSEGAARMGNSVDAATMPLRRGGMLQAVVPLAPGGALDGPLLIVRRPLDPLLSTADLLMGIGVVSLVLLAILWWGLGRSLGRVVQRLNDMAHGARAFLVDFRRPDQWPEWLARATGQRDEISQLGKILDQLMNEAERRHQEQAAYQQTLEQMEEAVLELDTAGRVLRVSRAWNVLTGNGEGIVGQPLAAWLHPDDTAAFAELVAALAQHRKEQATARLRLHLDDAQARWLELRLARAPQGECLRGVIRDVTQHYKQEQRITHMALHDALTGLPNRVLLEDRLKVALRLGRRSEHKVALGFIDLDHFKNVNDSLGHKTGDALLVALAQRLRQHLRSGDTLARWGGDEFVVLLPEMHTLEAVREVAQKLHAATEAPIRVDDTEFNITFSAGFAVYPDDTDNEDMLLSHADRAMFYAKAQGRNTLQLFCDMAKKGLGKKDVYIQQRLATAIREKRIVNHYQPLVNAHTGQVRGVEALARWFEPELGWIPPATFIPMAENLGLIRELGEQVWHRALHDVRHWKARGFGLSVNLSKRQLFMPYFTDKLLEDVAAHGLEPERVTLEMTESVALLDVEYAAERLKELHAAGFLLSIDDFGTGYSSLSLLHEMPVHELKIDIAFVRRIHQPQGARLIQTIVGMAQSLGFKTVAEGVEDGQTASQLADMGVDLLQGWHFGRPMTAQEFDAWWLDRHDRAAPGDGEGVQGR